MMTSLYTIGYQGQTIGSFIDTLLAHGVTQVIDVRQLPFSRKPDFSKKRLTAHLAAAGICYVHLAALGTPKPLRDELRRDHDYPLFFATMDALIAAQPAALAAAHGLALAQPSALLCFEANPHECHRLAVANALVQHAPALQIVHLPAAP